MRILVCNPPTAPRAAPGTVAWPALLAEAAGFLLHQPDTGAWLTDSVATGESTGGFLARLAEIAMDAVVFAAHPESVAADLELLTAAAQLRPVIVHWPGTPDSAPPFLRLDGVHAVVCGEPEHGLLAALGLGDHTVYPSDPVRELDDLPRPYRDHTVYRYRLPAPGLPDGPQLVVRGTRGPGRAHGAAWLADDIAFCLRTWPRLASVVLADEALDQATAEAYERVLRDCGRPFALACRQLQDGSGAPSPLPVAPQAGGSNASPSHAAPGTPTPSPPAGRAGVGSAGNHPMAPFPTLVPTDRRRILVVGQHNNVYMPPWLVAAADELGLAGVAVDPWQDPRAVGLLTQTSPDDLVICDRGLAVTSDLLQSTPGRTLLFYPDPLPVGADSEPQAWLKYNEFRRIAPAFDDVVMHDGHALEFLAGRGHGNVRGAVMLPYDPGTYRDLGLTRDIDVLFVGLESEHRRGWMARLKADGITVTWPQVWGPAFVEALNRSKIVLNLHSLNQPNTELRLCEAMACGCFVVSEPVTRPARFVDGEHYVEITQDTAAATIRRFLADAAGRQRMARAGQAHVAAHHTARHVLTDLLALLEIKR